jgi:hypothetical protein
MTHAYTVAIWTLWLRLLQFGNSGAGQSEFFFDKRAGNQHRLSRSIRRIIDDPCMFAHLTPPLWSAVLQELRRNHPRLPTERSRKRRTGLICGTDNLEHGRTR